MRLVEVEMFDTGFESVWQRRRQCHGFDVAVNSKLVCTNSSVKIEEEKIYKKYEIVCNNL